MAAAAGTRATAAAAATSPQRLWTAFALVGLSPTQPLQSLAGGDPGFVGSGAAYRPHLLETMPHAEDAAAARLPPPAQLATASREARSTASSRPVTLTPLPVALLQCCLPCGVRIVPAAELAGADLRPVTYSLVLTGQQAAVGLASHAHSHASTPACN